MKTFFSSFVITSSKKTPDTTASRFLEAVRRAIEEVCQHPEMGALKVLKHAALQGLCSWPVYFLSSKNKVRVVRVLHGKRDIDPMLEEDEASF